MHLHLSTPNSEIDIVFQKKNMACIACKAKRTSKQKNPCTCYIFTAKELPQPHPSSAFGFSATCTICIIFLYKYIHIYTSHIMFRAYHDSSSTSRLSMCTMNVRFTHVPQTQISSSLTHSPLWLLLRNSLTQSHTKGSLLLLLMHNHHPVVGSLQS